MPRFYLKYNSDDSKIDFGNAISINDLGDILKSLFSVIDATKSDNVVLSTITDNCYEIGFDTSNIYLEKRVEFHSKDILEKNTAELTNKQLRFKKALSKPMKESWYLEILNSDKKSIIVLPYGFDKNSVDAYYSNKTIEGFITLIGDRQLEPKNLHIYISGNDNFKIFITPEQHEDLAKHYRNEKLRFKIRLKKSLLSNRILSASLVNFRTKSSKKFPYNLDDLDVSSLNFKFD
jgi:hypothetical protein